MMSHGLTVTQGRHTGAIVTSHSGLRMEGTRSDVTWTQHDTRMCHSVAHGWRGHHSDVMWMRGQIEVMSRGWRGHHSDVTWTQCDTRTCHSMTRGWRGHVVMSPGLTMARGRHTGAIATSHGGTRTEGTRSDVTWTHGATRPCHSVTWGRRGCIPAVSHRLMVTQGWRGQIEVMSHGLSVTQGRVTL